MTAPVSPDVVEALQAAAENQTPEQQLATRILVDVAYGNPGAVIACSAAIAFDSIGIMADVLSSNLRGSALWVAYNDECGRDAAKFVALIRQLAANGGAR